MVRIIADRFAIEKLVGSGGMGEVFRATDRLAGGAVAIKILHGSKIRDAERFIREAQMLAEINHPRIVRYVAHGVVSASAGDVDPLTFGRPYIAMEWLEGEDLADRLDRSGLTLREALTLARRCAEALEVLHEKGIVHRDIKPSNVFLPGASVDHAKVLDLGVARQLHHRATTRSGIMVGTPGYMAPEQARGAKEVDARADVFALGCVLYECLAGRAAFAGENIAALLAKILLENPPTLRELDVDVPPALDELVSRMLSKRAASRPANGATLLKELEPFAAVKDVPAHRASARGTRALTAGERRLVCVVMAAISDETSSTEEGLSRPPDRDESSLIETVAATIDPRTIIASFGGEAEILANGSIVVTLAGKGGASDEVAHAARCALALRAQMVDANVVLATGLATVKERSVVGEVIERAAAILASSSGREAETSAETLHGQRPVFLDETTAGLLDIRFDVGGDERGLFIRGLRERESKARTLLGKPTPFVGRDRELANLVAIYEECVQEPVARAVLVTGFPGAGKSRLVTEFLSSLREKGSVEVALARGDAMSEGSPFSLVAKILRRVAGIGGGESLVVRQQKLRARVARNVLDSEVGRVSEFLGEIASIPHPDADSVQLRAARADPMLMGDQMRRAFCDFVVAESGAQPFVLVIEDLHWGDLPSVNLLDSALRAASERSFMVLAVGRGEVHDAFPQLWAQRSLQEVRLGPLVRRAGERLVRDVLGQDLNAAEVARLLDRAAGNVFYLEELIRAFAEGTGRAAARPGSVTGAPSSVGEQPWTLPTTILAMLEARLQHLDPMARRVLRAASIFGEAFWRDGVLALTGGQYEASEVDDWLAELTRREIVQRRDVSRFPGDKEYAFRHAIVRDAAYQMLTADDQLLGHRLAGDWLEQAGEHDSMLLGEHFERGGQRERGATFYGRAAFQALEGNDFVAAKVRADRAIQAGASKEEHGRLQLLLAEASRWSGEHEAAREHALAAMSELPPKADDWYVAVAEATDAAMTVGHADEATEIAKQLLEVAPMTAARVIATARVATSLGWFAGRYELAGELLLPIERDTDFMAREPGARAFLFSANVARALWEGDLERASVVAQEAVACFELVGDSRNATRQRLQAGAALADLGAYAVAEAVLRDARDDAERLGLLGVANDAKLRLGFICVRTHRLEEAVRTTKEVIDVYAAQRDRVGEGRAHAYLASVHYFANEHAAAEKEALVGLPLLEHAPPYRAAVLAIIALSLVQKGAPPEESYAAGAEAMRLLDEVGGATEGEAVIRLAYAEALFARGDLEGTRQAIVAARDRLLARASKISNPEYKRTFMNGVREHMRTLARAGEWLP